MQSFSWKNMGKTTGFSIWVVELMTLRSLTIRLRVSTGKIIIRLPFTSYSKLVLWWICIFIVSFSDNSRNHHCYLERKENVVVVHCNAGKGRTGTLISCYLIYSGLADNAEDALNYYGLKRFSHGKGVTQPSQIRYVHYFEQVYKRKIKTPLIKQPTKIVVHTIPDLAGNGKLTPYVEIVNGTNFHLLWTNRDS